MKRKIITIDEDLCNGCGDCVSACAEGALQIVSGKAKLVRDQYCDGFGDCLGDCPTGALKIVERDVPEYDPSATRDHVARTGSLEAVQKLDAAAQRHRQEPERSAPARSGCPGMAVKDFGPAKRPAVDGAAGLPPQVNPTELRQWPIQIHLVPPGAPFFREKELVVMSTCAPLASADVHWRFLRGRSVVVGCPKLDRTDGYVEKLSGILSEPSIPRVLVVRMEVPCCGGLTAIVRAAVQASGRKDLAMEEVTVALNGDVLARKG
ncbi:MAG: 4Fe-4S binding protein [Verrucomicrobia bacterium]|nr:4Fe-4S binding protein [Verrucomicrobiota bacterium]